MIKKCFLLIFFLLIFFRYDSIAASVVSNLSEDLNRSIFNRVVKEKIWLHRTNSKQKLEYYFNKYDGFEFDIFFSGDKNDIFCGHEINDKNISLKHQLEAYSTVNDKGLWLDLKNLNKENKYIFFEEINKIINEIGISKDVVFIESDDIESLQIFSQNGYNTTFMFLDYTSNGIEELKRYSKYANFYAISFPLEYYYLVNSIGLGSNICYLLWISGVEWEEICMKNKYKEILNDDRVKVILVDEI